MLSTPGCVHLGACWQRVGVEVDDVFQRRDEAVLSGVNERLLHSF